MMSFSELAIFFKSFASTFAVAAEAAFAQIMQSRLSLSVMLGGFAVFIIAANLYRIKRIEKINSRLLTSFIYLAFPFALTVATQLLMDGHPDNVLYIVMNYIAMFWLAASCMKQLANAAGYQGKAYGFSVFFIALSTILFAYLDLTVITAQKSEMGDISRIASFISTVPKLTLVIGLGIYLRAVIPCYIEGKSDGVRSFYKNFLIDRLLFALYFALSALWVFSIVELGFKFLAGVGMFGVFLSFLMYLIYRVDDIVFRFFNKNMYSMSVRRNLKRNTSHLFIGLSIYFYYLAGYEFLNFRILAEYLRNVYIIQTEIFSLNVFRLLSAGLLFFILKSILKLSSRYLRMILRRDELSFEHESIETIFYNLGILAVFTAVLLELGITWQVIVPVAGALGIGFGFGLKTILDNYASGFILLFSKKVKIGDLVELPGTAGRLIGAEKSTILGSIISIDMFATIVRTFDNIEIAVPNSIFISDTIINYTRTDKFIRINLAVGVAYASDVKKVKSVIMEAMNENEKVIQNREKLVWFEEYGDSSINFRALCWIKLLGPVAVGQVKSDLMELIFAKFDENNIEIPFPQRDVWFRNRLEAERAGRSTKGSGQPKAAPSVSGPEPDKPVGYHDDDDDLQSP